MFVGYSTSKGNGYNPFFNDNGVMKTFDALRSRIHDGSGTHGEEEDLGRWAFDEANKNGNYVSCVVVANNVYGIYTSNKDDVDQFRGPTNIDGIWTWMIRS